MVSYPPINIAPGRRESSPPCVLLSPGHLSPPQVSQIITTDNLSCCKYVLSSWSVPSFTEGVNISLTPNPLTNSSTLYHPCTQIHPIPCLSILTSCLQQAVLCLLHLPLELAITNNCSMSIILISSI